MSHWASVWAWEQTITNGGAKFVLVALAEFADAEAMAYPSQATLASMTGQGERTVRGHLAYLEVAGFLKRSGRWLPNGTRTSDLFQLSGGFKPAAKSAGGLFDNRQVSTGLPARNDIQPPADSARDLVREKELSVELSDNTYTGFEEFYSNYPRKENKPQALRAWKSKKLQPTDLPTLLLDVADRFKGVEKQYIPHPSTYLNNEKWKDEIIRHTESGFDARDRVAREEQLRHEREYGPSL